MVENRNKRLDSWKEIAGYLGRDIRTAIRWEREKGLPVHRVPGGKRQVVFGLSEEIDSWLRNGAAQDSSTRIVGVAAELPAAARPPAARRRQWASWAGIAIALLGLLGLGGYEWRRALTHGVAGLRELQLTANPAEDRVLTAAISPDGRHVAYSDLTGIFVRSADSGETRPVPVPPELRNPPLRVGTWFPDGGKLLGLRSTPEGTDIWIAPVLGEAMARLAYRFGYDPAISPDGRSIAFVSGEVGKLGRALWVGGIDGRSPLKLAESDEYLGLRNPAWSPDGRWIAYWRNKGFPSSVSIEVRPASGGPARTLIPASRLPPTYWQPFRAMIWLPGWRLIFSITEDSERGQGDGEIWALMVDKASGEARGQAERLARWNDQVLSSLTTTTDGKRLAMLKTRILDDVYVGDLERGSGSMKPPVRLTFDTRGSVLNSWTPDSLAILYESNRNGRWEVFAQGLHEAVPEMLVTSSGRTYGAKPSPDGAWLLYWEQEFAAPAGPPRPMRLMRRLAGGGPPQLVLEEPFDDFLDFKCPANPGADCVLADRGKGKEMVFSSLNPVGGKGARIAQIEVKTGINAGDSAAAWSVSPDGSRFAVVDAQPRIEIFSRHDGAWRGIPIDSGLGTLNWIYWAAGGSDLYAIAKVPGAFDLLRVNASGNVDRLLRKTGSRNIISLIPSPDGKHLAFTDETADSNVWAIENF